MRTARDIVAKVVFEQLGVAALQAIGGGPADKGE